MLPENKLVFHWEKRAEVYIFRCETAIQGDPDQFNAMLADIPRWCRAQRLRPEQFRFQAKRTSVSEKSEEFRVEGGRGGFSGSTVFRPMKLDVELELPESHGVMFTMAFPVSDKRV